MTLAAGGTQLVRTGASLLLGTEQGLFDLGLLKREWPGMGVQRLPLPPPPLAHHSTSHPAQNEPQVSKRIEPEKEHKERIRKWPPGVSGWEASPQGPWSSVLWVSHLLLPRRRPSGKPVSWALQSVHSGHSLVRELGDPSNGGVPCHSGGGRSLWKMGDQWHRTMCRGGAPQGCLSL